MKITLHQVYIFLKKIDVLYLSETYLKSTISFDDGSLEIPGYNLVRVDHPSYSKREGACIRSVICIPDLVHFLSPSSKEKPTLKRFLYFLIFRKWNTLALILKTFDILLYFRKWRPSLQSIVRTKSYTRLRNFMVFSSPTK